MKFPIRRPKDTVPAMLRPGEGVLVPEATQMLGGRKGINFLNRKAEQKAQIPVRHFQKGGVLPPDLAELARQSGVDPDLVNALYRQNQSLGNELDFPTEQELQYQFRDKLPPQHFAMGGVTAPVLGGVPTQDPRLAPRGMPDVFARPTAPPDPTAGGQVLQGGPTPAPMPGKYPPGVGWGGVPPGGGFQMPTLRQPEPFKPNVDPRMYGGGQQFGQEPMQYFEQGGTVEPPELPQNQWGMDFQGSYYPPDWMGPDNSPNNPQAPYMGGPESGNWMPDEYRQYWAHHGGDSPEGGGGYQPINYERNRRWLDHYLDGDRSNSENSGHAGNDSSGGYLYGQGSNLSQMSPYDPSFPYGSPGASGSGVPTQRGFGLLGNVVGGALGSFIPGGTGLGAKLGGWGARALTRAFQNYGANRNPNAGVGGGGSPGGGGGGAQGYGAMEGGMFSGLPAGFTEDRNVQGEYGAPNFYGPGGAGSGPQWSGDSIFGGKTNLNMALPGSFDHLGAGSHGDIGWNYFGNQGLKALMQGGDASLGFQGMPNANATGGAPVLPMNMWGGIGAGGMGGSGVQGGSTTQRRMSQQ